MPLKANILIYSKELWLLLICYFFLFFFLVVEFCWKFQCEIISNFSKHVHYEGYQKCGCDSGFFFPFSVVLYLCLTYYLPASSPAFPPSCLMLKPICLLIIHSMPCVPSHLCVPVSFFPPVLSSFPPLSMIWTLWAEHRLCQTFINRISWDHLHSAHMQTNTMA